MERLRSEGILLLHSFRDLFVRILPDFSDKNEYQFAFLVHPRTIQDVYRKYPLARHFPEKLLEFFLSMYWPVILSRVTGLTSQKSGKKIPGFILTIPLTARQMLENRELALKKIIQALRLAKKSGAKLIGLGGLTSSLTKGGELLMGKVDINITTGHAYTAFNVTQNLFRLVELLGADKVTTTVAFVGAAGSVGSTSAKIAARKGFNSLLLVDIERKQSLLEELRTEILKINSSATVVFSNTIADIKRADFIIAATNTPEALIKLEHLKKGAVIIDDAQPSDVAPEVLRSDEVLTVEAGVVHTPGILSHFNFNLKDKYDNFCCMAEVLILASLEHDDHFVIHRATMENVDEVAAAGTALGFRIAEFQNFNESIKIERISRIRELVHTQ